MAPEMWQDEQATVATDIYALGVTIFEMLHGAPPFQRQTPASLMYDHLEKEPPPLVGTIPGVSEQMETVVHKFIEKEPEDRYASVEEAAEAIHRAALTCISPTKLSTRPVRATRPEAVVAEEADVAAEPAENVDFDSPSSTYVLLKSRARLGGTAVLVAAGVAAVLLLGIWLVAGRGHEEDSGEQDPAVVAGILHETPVAVERELAATDQALRTIAWSPDGQRLAGVDAARQPGCLAVGGGAWPCLARAPTRRAHICLEPCRLQLAGQRRWR
jgi:hypothetical protein